MNYAWARDFTLQLISQYTIAGDAVKLSYNNQADYVNKIPALLDDAQEYVATTVRRIRALVPLSALSRSRFGDVVVYSMPEDFWQMCSAGMVVFRDGKPFRYHRYHMLGERQFALDQELPGTVMVEYYRHPIHLGMNPADDDKLDNTYEVQAALPYYVAAHLAMQDDAFAYQALYNEFESRLSRLTEMPQTEFNTIEDVYDPVWMHELETGGDCGCM